MSSYVSALYLSVKIKILIRLSMRLKLQDGISLRSTMKEKIESTWKIYIILFDELTEVQMGSFTLLNYLLKINILGFIGKFDVTVIRIMYCTGWVISYSARLRYVTIIRWNQAQLVHNQIDFIFRYKSRIPYTLHFQVRNIIHEDEERVLGCHFFQIGLKATNLIW